MPDRRLIIDSIIVLVTFFGALGLAVWACLKAGM